VEGCGKGFGGEGDTTQIPDHYLQTDKPSVPEEDVLGHANISTTEKYLHASGDSLRGGTASIENYLEKALANGSS